MTVSCCPRCGADMDSYETMIVGDLTIGHGGATVSWKGEDVKLTASERLIVIALAKAEGAPIKRDVLAETMGHDGEDPLNTVAVLLHRIRRKFEAIDPAFDRIDSIRGFGVRWL